jgi:hypothetical protein
VQPKGVTYHGEDFEEYAAVLEMDPGDRGIFDRAGFLRPVAAAVHVKYH